MKKFLKQLAATILGLAIFTGFWILVSLVPILILVAPKNKNVFTSIKPNTILNIGLKGQLVAHDSNRSLNRFKEFNEKIVSLSEVTKALTEAEEDPNIVGIYIYIYRSFSVNHADLDTLIHALEKCKKPIVVNALTYDDSTLALASTANHIILKPTGIVHLKGESMTTFFYKGTLEHFGIEPLCYRPDKCKYKSFIEPYTRNSMSEESKEQINKIINTLHNQCASAIMKNRKIPKEVLDKIYNESPILNPNEALKHNLIDEIYNTNAVNKYFHSYLNSKLESEKDYNHITVDNYSATATKKSKKTKIVVLPLKGDIVLGKSEKGKIGAKTVDELLEKYAEDPNCKAIIIQLYTHGGSVVASNCIRDSIIETQTKKPVVVLMRNVTASAGYHIATLCKIIAPKGTITGSIGVIGLGVNINKGLKDWLHINVETLNTHSFSNMDDSYHSPTEQEKAITQHHIDDLYDSFLDDVAKGRGMSKEQVEEIAGGRVWMTEEALEKGLIDKIGYLQDAVDIAAKQANIADGEYTVTYHGDLTLKGLIEWFTTEEKEKYIQQLHPHLKHLKHLEERKGIQAYWPYKIVEQKT